MNESQRVIVLVACVAAAVMFIVPPWAVRTVGKLDLSTLAPQVTETRVYASVVSPPPGGAVDYTRLALQLLSLSVATVGLFVGVAGERTPRESESAAEGERGDAEDTGA